MMVLKYKNFLRLNQFVQSKVTKLKIENNLTFYFKQYT